MNKASLDGVNIGFAITASYCTFSKILKPLRELVDEGAHVTPIFSFEALKDSRFMAANDFLEEVVSVTGNEPIKTIHEAEPIGPKALFDIMVVAPCTSNTIGKLAHGITDTAVTMACKAHLRNERPLLIAISTNDALSMSASNIGTLLNRKHHYFVPFRQDDYIKKPRSLVADMNLIPESVKYALSNKQIQPLITIS